MTDCDVVGRTRQAALAGRDHGGAVVLNAKEQLSETTSVVTGEAAPQLRTQRLIDLLECVDVGVRLGRQLDEPHPAVLRIRLAAHQTSPLERVDYRSCERSRDLQEVRKLALTERAMLPNERQQTCLCEIQAERCQRRVEGTS